MTNQYAKRIPIDNGGNEMQAYPAPIRASVVSVSDNAVASSVISLQPNTTQIEVGVIGGLGAVIRWVPTAETAAVAPRASVVASGLGANFDHFIPAGSRDRFVVPKETQGNGTGVHQIGSTFGLIQRLARINATTSASSVIVIEY